MEIFNKLMEAKEFIIAILAGAGGYLLKFLSERAKNRNVEAEANIKEANAKKLLAEAERMRRDNAQSDIAFIIQTLKDQLTVEIHERKQLAEHVKNLETKLLVFADENFQLKKDLKKLENENSRLRKELTELNFKYETLKKQMGASHEQGKE